jgi:hypothetical protein
MIASTSNISADLLRSRKQVVTDERGVEKIVKDLYCCNENFATAHLCNVHYRQKHQSIPPSDPMNWPDVTITDITKHMEANIRLTFAENVRFSTFITPFLTLDDDLYAFSHFDDR